MFCLRVFTESFGVLEHSDHGSVSHDCFQILLASFVACTTDIFHLDLSKVVQAGTTSLKNHKMGC